MYSLLDHINLIRLRAERFIKLRKQWNRYRSEADIVRVNYLCQKGITAAGGAVKLIDLNKEFPNHPHNPTILYVVSSVMNPNDDLLVTKAKAHNIRIVLNQNGVAYPAWHGRGWRFSNRVLKHVLHRADYVIYQSRFSKKASDRFLGDFQGKSEVMHNPVDTSFFSPGDISVNKPPIYLLTAGSHHQFYRIKNAIDTLSILLSNQIEARLLLAGRFVWKRTEQEARQEMLSYIEKKSLESKIEIVGTYPQKEAPALMRRAHILLHAKYNDNCPRLIVEAMACGLPVVYSSSGGTPELVGYEGGIGIEAPLSWEETYIPSPEAMADAVCRIMDQYVRYRNGARRRAVKKFDVKPWLERHGAIFKEVLKGN